jgi:hypothetical protein
MTASPHDHSRPGVPEQRAVLRVNRAILRGATPEDARQAAGDGACPECAVTVAAAFGINLAEQLALGLVAKLAPGAELDLTVIRRALLEMIDDAERDLGTGLN